MESLESNVVQLASWLRLIVEAIGAAVIGVGVTRIAFRWVRRHFGPARRLNFRDVRLQLSQHLAVALEFQLAGDILSTAVAPTWQEIGKLGAVAGIRTFLNYFLEREMKGLQELTQRSHGAHEATAH